MSAERIPELSLERIEETEVIYVAMPHAVRLPPPQRRAIVPPAPWTEVREQVAVNLAAFAYAIGFTITVALFAVGIYVLKLAVFGMNDPSVPAHRVEVVSAGSALPVFDRAT